MMDGSDRSDDGQIVSVASVQPRTYTHYTILWLAHAGTCFFSLTLSAELDCVDLSKGHSLCI